MVAADVEEANKEAYLQRKGFDVVGAREWANHPKRFAIFGLAAWLAAPCRALTRAGYFQQLKPAALN